MAKTSGFRTEVQDAAARRIGGQGFAHDRDSEYDVRRGSLRLKAVLVVLFGYERYAVVYPDGSVETRERKRGGSKTVTFNREKLIASAGFSADSEPTTV